VPDHDAQAGGGGALHQGERAEQAALLHDLDLHQVGRLAPDDLDQRGGGREGPGVGLCGRAHQ